MFQFGTRSSKLLLEFHVFVSAGIFWWNENGARSHSSSTAQWMNVKLLVVKFKSCWRGAIIFGISVRKHRVTSKNKQKLECTKKKEKNMLDSDGSVKNVFREHSWRRNDISRLHKRAGKLYTLLILSASVTADSFHCKQHDFVSDAHIFSAIFTLIFSAESHRWLFEAIPHLEKKSKRD